MAKNLDSGGWIVVVHTKALAPSPVPSFFTSKMRMFICTWHPGWLKGLRDMIQTKQLAWKVLSWLLT